MSSLRGGSVLCAVPWDTSRTQWCQQPALPPVPCPQGLSAPPVLLCLLRTWLCYCYWKQRRGGWGRSSQCSPQPFTASLMCCFLASCFLVWCLLCLLQVNQIDKGRQKPRLCCSSVWNSSMGCLWMHCQALHRQQQ